VGIICQRLVLSCKSVGRIVYQGFLRPFLTQCFVESARHAVQFDEGHLLTTGHRAHSFGVVAVGIAQCLVVAVEEAACCRSDKDDVPTLLTHAVGKYFQVAAVAVPGAVTGAFLLLVVMAKLTNDVVAGPQLGEDLIQPQLGQESSSRKATLGIVGNGYAGVEPAGDHLSPRSPGLVLLVDNGTIATKEHRSGGRVGLYMYALYSRGRSTKVQSQRVVPILIRPLARLQFHLRLGIDARRMLVDYKANSLVLTLLGTDDIKEMAAALCSDNSFCRPLLRT